MNEVCGLCVCISGGLWDYFTSGEPPHVHLSLVFELHSTSLHEVLSDAAALPHEDVAMRYFHELASGISHLHSKGLIHGDVNPPVELFLLDSIVGLFNPFDTIDAHGFRGG